MKPFVPFLVLSLLATSALGDAEMLARSHSEAFARAMNARDVDGVLAFYADDARVVWPGLGEEARGKAAIRALIESTLQGFPKDSTLTLKSQDAFALSDGYIATVSHWEQSYTRGDGTKAATAFRATETIRVSGRATLYVVDHASFGRGPPGGAKPAATAPAAREGRRYTFVECNKFQRNVSSHTVTPGDVPGHRYSVRVWRHNYTTTDPDYGEADTTIFQVVDEVLGAGTNFGTAVDTLANGDSIFWQFRGTHKADSAAGGSTFEGTGVIVGGTGKYKNARGREAYRGKVTAAGCRTEGEAEWDY